MVAVILTVVFAVLIMFNNTAFANYGSKFCKSSPVAVCYRVKHGQSWTSLFPNSDERDLVKRINHMNTHLYSGLTIAIPKSDDYNINDYSPMPSTIDPHGSKLILVSLHDQAFGAYNADGTLAYWGPVSSARGYCPDIHHGCHTPTGHFAIESHGGPDCVSTKFPVGRGGAPMPYCMYFHGGFALHGSPELPGYPASHGCIRMFIDDAQWLNQEFTAGEHTRVIVDP